MELKPAAISSTEKNRRRTRFIVFFLLVAAVVMGGFVDAEAAKEKKKKAAKAAETKPYSAIVIDAQTGEVLMARQADSIRHPASLTKIMTLYMLFAAVDSGELRMSDNIKISQHAASMSPSKLGLRPGSSIRVEDAVKAVVTKSANDVAAAIAERLGNGSETIFAARMTRKAHDLGMSRTNFRNASGLPDVQQVTSARDMAKLALAMLRDYPHYYHYFGIRNFEYKGASMHNHNRLLGEYPGLDGIKTGYINASGFNLVASAKQNGRRLVGVVFGGRSWQSRNATMVGLLDDGFAELKRRGGNLQVASAPLAVVPIPAPPPMTADETRGVEAAQSDPNATDVAEEGVAETQVASITPPAPVRSNVPRPAARPPLAVSPTTAATARPTNAATQAAITAAMSGQARTTPQSAAPTVMQLRIPRSQLPAGIPQSQIVSNQPIVSRSAPQLASVAPAGGSGSWAIQVGAFPSRVMTDQALRTAQSRLPAHLAQGQPVIVPQSTANGMIFRARLQGYNEVSANAACQQLGSCLVVAPGS